MKDKELVIMLQQQIAEKDKQIEKLQFLLDMKIGHYHEPSILYPFFLIDKGNVLEIDLNRVISYLEFKGLEVKDDQFVFPEDGFKKKVSFEWIKNHIYKVLEKQALQFENGQYTDVILNKFYQGFGLTNNSLKDMLKSR